MRFTAWSICCANCSLNTTPPISPWYSTPRARPFAMNFTPTTRRTARRCRTNWWVRSNRCTRSCARLGPAKLLQIGGVEADDVIGTLATQASAAGLDTLVSTGDKDMAQLMDGSVKLVNTMTDTVLDRDGVVEKFGVPPERIVDWLALIGDTSDNIPGVPGVGPKTASKWLTQYGSLDALVTQAGEIPGKAGENLRAALAQLPLARQLATIRCDVPLKLKPTELERASGRRLAARVVRASGVQELAR